MPETNFLNPTPESAPENIEPEKAEKVKKPRKSAQGGSAGGKAARKKKAAKPPFAITETSAAKPVTPKAEMKAKNAAFPAKKDEHKNTYFKYALSFIVLTVILAAAAIYFGFSKVTLVLIPAQEKISDSLSLAVIDRKSDDDAALSPGQVWGIVRQAPVAQTRIFPSSGKEVLGEEVTGKITLINNYMKNQPLVATTRLLSQDNKLFRLKNTVNIPAGGQVEAEIYADEPSAAMAIGPARFTIPGLWAGLQDKIYGESKEPMEYSEKAKKIVKQEDIDNAVAQIKASLLNKAKMDIGQAFNEYDQSAVELDNNSISQEVVGKVGEERENFTIMMKADAKVVAFKNSDIYENAKIKLADLMADDKEISEFNPDDLTYDISEINIEEGTALVNVNYSAKATLKNSAGIIKKDNLAGMQTEELKAYLNSLPEIAGYEIKTFPSFIKKLPNLVDRIEIEIKK